METNPLVISGLSGSGTRVIVSILKEVNFSFGYDVNVSDDDLSFTLLLKLPQHYYKYFNKNAQYVENILRLHDKLLQNKRLNPVDITRIIKLSVLHALQFRRYKPSWIIARLKNIAFNRKTPSGLWGWKEPHNITFLSEIHSLYPSSKFLLIIRNGLDMVYSKNDQQFYTYGHYFGIDCKDESSINRFEFWYRFNKHAIEIGKLHYKDRFLIVYYEDLVKLDEKSLKKPVTFITELNSDDIMKKIMSNLKDPGTIGRYKKFDTSWVNKEVKDKLEEIGYDISTIDI